MGLNRRGFMWISIIFELSLIMGVGLYVLSHSDSPVNEGGLVRSIEVEPFPSFQVEEVTTDGDDPPGDEGGPYTVDSFFHVSLYHAKNGDNLWTIARKSNLDFYTILSVNRLEKANDISVGQKLRIPNQRGILHTVGKGETLEDVALNYDVSIRRIIRVNRILNPNEIKPGTDLFVPGAKITHEFSRELLRNSGIPPEFLWPCRRSGRISSGFGYRKDPFTGRRAFHSGTDFAPGYGANVCASMSGRVTYVGWMGGYGRLVVVRHNSGYSTRYGHLSSIVVKKGRYVRQGQVIGRVGSSGRSTGPHLHFEIRKNGKPVNPLKLLRR